MTTAPTKYDDRTEGVLASLLPAVQGTFRLFLDTLRAKMSAQGITAKLISGTRGEAEQRADYAKGRTTPGPIVTKANWGYSYHNFGIAVDVGLFNGSDYLEDSPLYKQIGPIARACGLEWGGDWKSIVDEPHVQFPTGLTLAQMRQRQGAGVPLVHVPVPVPATPDTSAWTVEIGGRVIISHCTDTPSVRATAEALGATLEVVGAEKRIILHPDTRLGIPA